MSIKEMWKRLQFNIQFFWHLKNSLFAKGPEFVRQNLDLKNSKLIIVPNECVVVPTTGLSLYDEVGAGIIVVDPLLNRELLKRAGTDTGITEFDSRLKIIEATLEVATWEIKKMLNPSMGGIDPHNQF